MYYNDDMNADKNVVVYTWRQTWDFEWRGDPHFGHPEPRLPPSSRVFAVIVQLEKKQSSITGSIEHWNWLQEANDLPGAPVNWGDRYDKKLWSRK